MVLAAGLGKRMRPLSATTPKPLVEVGGRALIDHCLDGLAAVGVETAVVNVHYLADLDRSAPRSAASAPQIVISDERDALLDTGGGISKALPLLGDEPFLLRNSDSFWLEGVRPNLALARRRLGRGADGCAAAARLHRALRSAIPAAAISSWTRTAA